MEIWKEIEGFNGKYSVSDQGRIRQNRISYISKQNHRITTKEKIITPFTWQSRYLRVDLQNKNTGKRLSTYVHKLVAEYFIGPRPEGMEIDHIDKNYLNNRADNLRYVTHYENMHNRRELTDEQKVEQSNKMKKWYDSLSEEKKKERGRKISEAKRLKKTNGDCY